MTIEIYKIYVQTAENNSDRRQRYNGLFFVILSAVIAFLSQYLASYQDNKLPIFVASLLGLIICWAWFAHIESHKAINKRKFEVIHEIEKSLDPKPFQKEWVNREHTTLSTIEKKIPLVFGIGFAISIVVHCYLVFVYVCEALSK